MIPHKFEEMLTKVCKEINLDAHLLAAIVEVESSWDPFKVRWEPNFQFKHHPQVFAQRFGITEQTEVHLQSMSWGLTQIMGCTARDFGFTGMLTELIDPFQALLWGGKYIHSKLALYPTREDAISAYNGGLPLRDKRLGKEYKNQDYVDKVLKAMEH